MEMLKKLSLLNGTSGDENAIREFILQNIKDDTVRVTTDRLGNLIVEKKGKNTPKNKVMIAAHMDEVGFIVTYISDDGFLNFAPVGGISPAVVLGRQVKFANGTVGVISTRAVHQLEGDEKTEQPKISSLLIDIGAKDKADAEKYVNLGDNCYFVSEYFEFGDGFIKGKALDDRVGCAIMLDMINSELEYDCTFAFTVQEEVGTRGAGVAAYNVKPHMAIVLETTTACDIADVSGAKKVCILGNGCVVSYMDRNTIYSKDLYKLAFETAKENGLKCQTKTMVAGGNDSGAIHKAVGGIKTLAMSLPCRYLHSPSCVIKKSDYEETRVFAEKMLCKMAQL